DPRPKFFIQLFQLRLVMLDVLVRFGCVPVGRQLGISADFYFRFAAGDVIGNLIARLVRPLGFERELVGRRGVALFGFYLGLITVQRILQRLILGEPGNISEMFGDVVGVAIIQFGDLFVFAFEQEQK